MTRRQLLRGMAAILGGLAAVDSGFVAGQPASVASPGTLQPRVWLPALSPPSAPTVQLGVGASLGGRRLFPADNAWNLDISGVPPDPNSDALIASIGLTTGLHPDFGTTWQGAP